MTVEPATAKYKFERKGKVYYFCCAQCLEKFRADPDHYLSQTASASGMHSAPQIVGIAPASAPRTAAAKIALATAALPTPAKAARKETAYVCPCAPKCEPPSRAPARAAGWRLSRRCRPWRRGVEYTCPMHPEIIRPGPGNCPICGMALEPRTVTATGGRKSRVARDDSPILDQPGADRPVAGDRDGGHAAGNADAVTFCRAAGCPGSNWFWRRRWCCGVAGRFSSAAGLRS